MSGGPAVQAVPQVQPVAPAHRPVLQRQCACGQHTGGSGECAECRKKKRTLQRAPAGQLRQPALPRSRPAGASAARFNHDFSRIRSRGGSARPESGVVISLPGDRHEREADRVADRVMRTPAPPVSWRGPAARVTVPPHLFQPKPRIGPLTPLVQRRADCTQGQAGDDQQRIQVRRATGVGAGAEGQVSNLAERVRALDGGGHPLDTATRDFFEPRFARDFSRVRIHTGVAASLLAESVRARAFTYGRNIVFGSGQFAPGSRRGMSLLAHELTHTVQQGTTRALRTRPNDGEGRGTRRAVETAQLSVPSRVQNSGLHIQRKFAPLKGSTSVCAKPPSPRRLGVAAHSAIQKKFLKGGKGRRKELPLPFTDTSACKAADRDRMEPPTSSGRPDLAIVERRAGKVVVRLGEIKPYNVAGVSAGHGVMLCYERAIERNADVCKKGPAALAGTHEAEAIPFCNALNAFNKEIELGNSIGWQPGFTAVTAGGVTRSLGTVNLGGVIGYFCPDKLLADEKKKAKKAAKKGAKKAAKKGAKTAAKTVAKKLIPGAAYAEAAMLATVLLAGCKPTFGEAGADLDEAFFDVLKNGPAPDVTIPDDLKALLDEHPDLLERMRKLEKGKGDREAAAKEMLKLLEDNKDLLDEETLEFLVAAMEGSERSSVKRNSKDVRRILEAVKAGAKPGPGGPAPGGQPEDAGPTEKQPEAKAEETTETEAETEAAGPAAAEGEGGKKAEKPAAPAGETEPATKGGGEAGSIPPELKKEIDSRKPLADLFKFVRTKAQGGPALDSEKVKRFLEATRGLTDEQLAQIEAEVAKLPAVDETTPAEAGREDAIALVERLARALKAGGQPGTTQAPAAALPTATQMKWVLSAIRSLEGGKSELGGRTRFAQPKSVAEAVTLGVGGKGHGGHASKVSVDDKTQIIGAYVTLAITKIEQIEGGAKTKVTWEIVGSTLAVDKGGNPVGVPIPRRVIEVVGPTPKSKPK